MTDPEQEPQPQPKPEQQTNPIGEIVAQLTMAEKLVGGGALLLLLTWFFGELLLNDYGLDDIVLPLSVAILAGIYSYFRAGRSQWHSLYPWIVAAAALGVAIIGFDRFLEDFRVTGYSGSSGIWRIIYAAATVMLGWGGFAMLTNE